MTAFLSSFPYRRWQRRHNQREPNLWWSEWFFLIPFNVACDARLWKCEAVRLWISEQNHTLRWYGYFRRNEFIAVRDEQRQPQFASKACMKRRTNRTISVVAEAKPNKFRNYIRIRIPKWIRHSMVADKRLISLDVEHDKLLYILFCRILPLAPPARNDTRNQAEHSYFRKIGHRYYSFLSTAIKKIQQKLSALHVDMGTAWFHMFIAWPNSNPFHMYLSTFIYIRNLFIYSSNKDISEINA